MKAKLTCVRASVLDQLGSVDEARRDLLATASRTDIDAETVAECFTYLAFLAQNVNDGAAAVDYARRAQASVATLPRALPAMSASLTGTLAYGLHLMGRNDEATMIEFFLIACGRMTVEAGDAFAGVGAHFKFVHHGRRLLSMTLGTLARGASKRSAASVGR